MPYAAETSCPHTSLSKLLLFEVLSLGIISYAAIGNRNNLSSIWVEDKFVGDQTREKHTRQKPDAGEQVV